MVMMLDVCRDDDRIRFHYRRVGMRFVDAVGLYLQAVTTRRPIYSENICPETARPWIWRWRATPSSTISRGCERCGGTRRHWYGKSWRTVERSRRRYVRGNDPIKPRRSLLPSGARADTMRCRS
jgi:hypothetical protein